LLDRPVVLLRIEEFCLLCAALLAYSRLHFSWVLFAVLFLAPDLFMFGYLVSVRLGTATYNLGHFLLLPLALFGFAYEMGWRLWMAVGIIWFSHIALDRMLGFGMKYPTNFKDTHLQHLG
jgi:hypothetical protein